MSQVQADTHYVLHLYILLLIPPLSAQLFTLFYNIFQFLITQPFHAFTFF